MISPGPDLLSKQISRDIKLGLKNGQSKQELFVTFRTDENENQLRRLLAKFPDRKPKIIYKVMNIIAYIFSAIFALGAFVGLFETISVKSIASFLIPLFITIELIKFNGNIYLPGIIYIIWSLFDWYLETIRMIKTNEINEDGSVAIVFIGFTIPTMLVVFLAIIRKKVFRHYKWFSPYKDQNGLYIFESNR